MNNKILKFIKDLYPNETPVPLHEPRFIGNEKKYLAECIDTTYVSYVGKFVNQFEDKIKEFTGAKYAIATSNGTLALHMALILAGVKADDEVLTQTLTFVATANAVSYTGAKCVFIDSDKDTMGMCPDKLQEFLINNCEQHDDGFTYNKKTSKRISVCIPMHVFGHPVKIDKIVSICKQYNILVIEDAAESLGSYYKNKHTGLYGEIGILSFNGNKVITTGGGGMIITNNDELAKRALHLTKTAKVSHPWEFIHDEVGYNYRLSNLNAAVGCSQMECIKGFLENKRNLANKYIEFFRSVGVSFFKEPKDCISNYWLNCMIVNNREERDAFLKLSNDSKVTTRPIWRLMNKLPMYSNCESTNLDVAQWFEDRVINIPSSVRIK